MADRTAKREWRDVRLAYSFDRLLTSKIQQAYEMLAPDTVRVTGEHSGKKEKNRDGCSDLHPGVVGQAAREEHDCQPDDGADRLRTQPRSPRTGRVDLRRRRL